MKSNVLNHASKSSDITFRKLLVNDDSGKCGEDANYSFNASSGELTIFGRGKMIDSSHPWQSYSSSVKKVIISDNITSIGENAFQWCSSLTSIEIPVGVTSIGENAFQGCSSLTSIEIPVGVTSIGERAFDSCYSLTSIEIPVGVCSQEL